MAYGILVPLPGIEPWPSAVKAWSPKHWTTKEFPILSLKECWYLVNTQQYGREYRGKNVKGPHVEVAFNFKYMYSEFMLGIC